MSDVLVSWLCVRFAGLGTALADRLGSYTISGQDAANEIQPRHIKVLRVPEYFAEYREKGDGLASFLGTSIVSKVCVFRVFCAALDRNGSRRLVQIVFGDSAGKNFVSKHDYSTRGPRAVLGMSPSLL